MWSYLNNIYFYFIINYIYIYKKINKNKAIILQTHDQLSHVASTQNSEENNKNFKICNKLINLYLFRKSNFYFLYFLFSLNNKISFC